MEKKCYEDITDNIDKNLIRIIDALIDDTLELNEKGDLTRENLNNAGFSNEVINDLEAKRLLIVSNESNACYKLSEASLKYMFRYGLRLYFVDKSDDWALKCFKFCYEYGKMRSYANQYMVMLLNNGNYFVFYRVLMEMEESQDERLKAKLAKFKNLGLLLLSYMWNEFPIDKHKEVKEFKVEDLFYEGERKHRNKNKKEMVSYLLTQEFKLAIGPFKGLYDYKLGYSSHYELLWTLINKTIGKSNYIKKKLFELSNDKNYKGMVKFLEKESKRRNLSIKEECILLTVREIVRLLNGEKVIMPTTDSKLILKMGQNFNIQELHRAISGKNYSLALAETSNFVDEEKEQNNVLYNMLVVLTNLIANIKDRDTSVNESDLQVIIDMIKKDNISLEECSLRFNLDLEQILLVKLYLAKSYYFDAVECFYYSKEFNNMTGYCWFRGYWQLAKNLYDEVCNELNKLNNKPDSVVSLLEELNQIDITIQRESNNNSGYKKFLAKNN